MPWFPLPEPQQRGCSAKPSKTLRGRVLGTLQHPSVPFTTSTYCRPQGSPELSQRAEWWKGKQCSALLCIMTGPHSGHVHALQPSECRGFRCHPLTLGQSQSTCIVQEPCESRSGRPGLSVLTSLLVSVDVKLYSHASALVSACPYVNRHPRTLSNTTCLPTRVHVEQSGQTLISDLKLCRI